MVARLDCPATKAFKNFVNGKHVDAADGRTTAVVNPATGEQYAEAPLSGPADIDAAMEAAAAAFDGLARHARRASGRWRCSGSPTRSRPAPRS